MLAISAFTAPVQEILEENNELLVSSLSSINEINTIVVPARKDGFDACFLGAKCWYKITISADKLRSIKYIAAYQVTPTSAITHIAEVDSISIYDDSGKYILKFKNDPIKIKNVTQNPNKIIYLMSPRYTTYEKIMSCTYLDELWPKS
jgi:hypothetical protein